MTTQPKDVDSQIAEKQKQPLITGNLWRAIWIMSWPLLLTTVANSFVGICDVYVARFLGSNIQAAVGLAEHVLFLFLLFIRYSRPPRRINFSGDLVF